MGGTPSTPNKKDILSNDLRFPGDDDEEEAPISPPQPYFIHLSKTINQRHNEVNCESVIKGYDFSALRDPMKGISENENFGILPLSILNTVMLFTEISDLPKLMLVCRLFNSSCNNQFFWKSYFSEYFKENDQLVDLGEVNWKKLFFIEYFKFSDDYYLKKYKKIEIENGIKFTDLYENVTHPVIEFKVNVLGKRFSGKSNLINRFLGKEFSGDHSRIGHAFFVRYFEYETKEKREKGYVRLNIWDHNPPRPYRCIAPMHYRGSDCGLITFGIDSMEDFDRAKGWVKEYLRNNYEPSSTCRLGVVVLVGTKSDLGEEKREVFYEEHIQRFVEDYNIPYAEVSSKNNVNVQKVFGMVVDLACDARIKFENQNHNT